MSTEYEMDGVTITLEAGERLKLGDSLTFRAPPPWWRRAMEWIAVRIFRRPRYDSVITHVDRERGIITVDKVPRTR